MNDFILLIHGADFAYFFSDSLEELNAMTTFGDTFRIMDMATGNILAQSKDLE